MDGTAGVCHGRTPWVAAPGNLGLPRSRVSLRWPWMAPQACIQSTGSDGIGGLAAAVAARLPTSRSQIASK